MAFEAFRTGAYGGKTYSGKYGDLAATVAAVAEAKKPAEKITFLQAALRPFLEAGVRRERSNSRCRPTLLLCTRCTCSLARRRAR